MKRFRFPLQRLLEIRQHKENIIKNQMAQIQRKKISYQQKKEAMLERYAEGIKNMKNEKKSRILSIAKFQLYQNYFGYLKNQVDKQDALIKLVNDEIKIMSKKLIEARKEKRILERLREKSLQKYFYELRKEEQNFFDEVGTNRFARKDIGEKSAETKKHKIEIPLKLPEREDLTKKMYEEIISGEKE